MPAGISAQKRTGPRTGPFCTLATTVGAGFYARPASVDGQRGHARIKWCADCARAPLIGVREPHTSRRMPKRPIHTRPQGAPSSVHRGCGIARWDRRIRWACPAAPASPTVRAPRVHSPARPIPRAPPAHHFVRANRCSPLSHAGRAWKPSPTERVGRWVDTYAALNPSVTAQSAATAPLSGEPGGGVRSSGICASHTRRSRPQSRRR